MVCYSGKRNGFLIYATEKCRRISKKIMLHDRRGLHGKRFKMRFRNGPAIEKSRGFLIHIWEGTVAKEHKLGIPQGMSDLVAMAVNAELP